METKPRTSEIVRKTSETDICLFLDIDGSGNYEVDTGVPFLDHMLELFAKHGCFDLKVKAQGDTKVDDHHSVEDIGICLGKAFREALGDKAGITRYADTALPMDEALILSAVDISGRGLCVYALEPPTEKIGTFDTQLAEEFFIAFASNAALTLHLRQLSGRNSHHIIEGAFKSAARSLRKAVAIDPALNGEVLSTKGVLE